MSQHSLRYVHGKREGAWDNPTLETTPTFDPNPIKHIEGLEELSRELFLECGFKTNEIKTVVEILGRPIGIKYTRFFSRGLIPVAFYIPYAKKLAERIAK